ncbi:hypothetical protein EKL30_08680 [Candidimonas sp. SYP-B2681]|uniref:DUF6285 domain-containing protein n=1 Tax=Candidimonas sp. SYP-B2681 TaxID=2497686 RepID=UPI000F86A9EE|nr:DUF6285 domain-containing protein [Candidimonas sp. SYP-B2681]RTZ44627.1 hypothetical protein EKL30_08680 [Candidimonas sp. SYP-B2681]
MINQPDGFDLLETARRALLDTILPGLPAEKTYTALMIANAMGIASRELQALPKPPLHNESIAALLGMAGVALDDNEPVSESFLATIIRQQAIPQEHERALRALLLALTHDKLRISNPKYLSS